MRIILKRETHRVFRACFPRTIFIMAYPQAARPRRKFFLALCRNSNVVACVATTVAGDALLCATAPPSEPLPSLLVPFVSITIEIQQENFANHVPSELK